MSTAAHEESERHRIDFDYQFSNRQGELVDQESSLFTCANLKAKTFGAPLFLAVPQKGKVTYVIHSIVNWIRRLGHDKGLLLHDDEPAVRALARAVQSQLGPELLQIRESPKYSHQSLGLGESSNSQMAGMFRTWIDFLRSKYPEVDINHLIISWLPMWISCVWTRRHVQHTGVTPFRALHGVDYSSQVCGFGESGGVRSR